MISLSTFQLMEAIAAFNYLSLICFAVLLSLLIKKLIIPFTMSNEIGGRIWIEGGKINPTAFNQARESEICKRKIKEKERAYRFSESFQQLGQHSALLAHFSQSST